MIRLGLRTKFFLYSNSLILVTMTLVAVLSVANERRTLHEAITARGRSLVEAMAIPITDALMYEELGLVEESGLIDNDIIEILERNRDLMRYVIVTDPAGRVTHSNRWDLMGTFFPRALGPEAAGQPADVAVRLNRAGERVLEIRTTLNISSKTWGAIAVGFTLEPVEQQVRALARRVALVGLALMLGNSIMTAVYVETLIRPILNLNQTMQRAGAGDLTVRAPARHGDEVAELSKVFNLMMDELEEANERDEAQRAQLAHTEKMAAVGTLAAGVAHEVNNPLAGVLACLDNLADNPDDADMRQRYLALIRDGLKRIERTVANLLDFSRRREIRPEPTSLNHSLHHVVELVSYQLRKAQVSVEMELDPGRAVVMADHFQMEQLFLNLVLNAVQAMPRGGTLTLRTLARRGKVVVEVQDTGVGVPPAIRDRIFDPFFTTRGVGQGTGLGLAVSDSIVAAHGGTIEVESKVGVGSKFRVVFDALAEESDRREA